MKKKQLSLLFNNIFFIIFILFLLFSFSCSSRNPTIKSDIKKKIDYLINQANGYFQNNQIDKALTTLNEAYQLSISIDDIDRIVKSSLKLVEIYIFVNQPDKAYFLIIFCKKIVEKENKKNYLSSIFFYLAKYYEIKQKLDDAIASYKEAISKATNNLDKSIALNSLGLLYLKSSNFDEALNYLLQAYKINQKLKNYIQLANNAYNIAICYLNKKEFLKSLTYALNALEYDKISENPYNILADCKLLAKIYEALNDIESAIYYISKALNIAEIIAKDQIEFLTLELQRLQNILNSIY